MDPQIEELNEAEALLLSMERIVDTWKDGYQGEMLMPHDFLPLPERVVEAPQEIIARTPLPSSVWLEWFSFGYDLVAVLLAVGDTWTNVVVWYGWYTQGERSLFWGAISLTIIAQFTNLIMFTTRFKCPNFIWGLPILLCAPLIPYLIWIESLDLPFINSLWDCLRLEREADVTTTTTPEGDDPLKYMVKKVRMGHIGFTVSAWIGSLPQAILQTAAFLRHNNNNNAIPVISIILSILSFVSSGIFWSYSPHRPTFFFNWLCFLADGFGVFCLMSWLFYFPSSLPPPLPPSTPVFTVPYLPTIPFYSIFTVVWVHLFALLVAATLVFGVIAVVWLFWPGWREEECCEGCMERTTLTLLGTLLMIPGLAAAQMCNLCLLPLYFLHNQSLFSTDWENHVQIVEFFNNNHTDLRKRRKAFQSLSSYRVIRGKSKKKYHRKNNNDDEDSDDDDDEDEKTTNHQSCLCMRRKLGGIYRHFKEEWRSNGWKEFLFPVFCFLWVPFIIPLSLYSLVYPLCMFISTLTTTPSTPLFQKQNILQLSLSIVYLACNACLLPLIPSVINYSRLTSTIPIGGYHPREITQGLLNYKQSRQKCVRRNTTALSLYIANARGIRSSSSSSGSSTYPSSNSNAALEGHIVNLLPRIFEFAGIGEKKNQNQKSSKKQKQKQQKQGEPIAKFFTSQTLRDFIFNTSTSTW